MCMLTVLCGMVLQFCASVWIRLFLLVGLVFATYILISNDGTPHLLSVDDDSCRCVCDCVICSLFTDLKPLNESIGNVKAIELDNPPVETVLSALSGQVEELRLIMDNVCYPFQCLCTYSVLHIRYMYAAHIRFMCAVHIRYLCATHIRYMCAHVYYVHAVQMQFIACTHYPQKCMFTCNSIYTCGLWLVDSLYSIYM